MKENMLKKIEQKIGTQNLFAMNNKPAGEMLLVLIFIKGNIFTW